MHQFNRTIFTKRSPWETLADYALAVLIGLCLTMAALAYFDILA